MNWHQLEIDAVFAKLGTSRAGLSAAAVEENRRQFGTNELQEKRKKPAWVLFLNQFKGFMIVVLVVAAVISGIVGDTTDTIIILVIVLLNAVIGFVQEYRAEKAMDALKKMATQNSRVVRDGTTLNLSSAEIVPGDIVLLESGVVVPADMRLAESHSLRIEESSLTGESLAVDKYVKPIAQEDPPLGDRFNMAYKGTMVTNGRGIGVVTGTGMNTEIGKIAKMLQQDETATPLQVRMEDFGRKLSYIILLICVLLFVVGLLRGEEPMNMLLVAISLAVAAIPEALPALITIALARGAKRLVEKNTLVRKLPAVETLGSVTYICTDKTGTLTQNKMQVVNAVPAEHEKGFDNELPLLESVMCLNHDAIKSRDGQWIGDPMEVAIVDFVGRTRNADAADFVNRYPRVGEIPFDSDRKCMTTIHEFDNRYLIVTKGAAESVGGRLRTEEIADFIYKETNKQAREGMRVIAYGFRFVDDLDEPYDPLEVENNLEYAGLIGLIDPPREEVKKAIAECKSAGIQPVMITGDHPETAAAIATQIGLLEHGDLKMSGEDLSRTAAADFESKVEKVKVYSRVSPEQKLIIVKALQQRKHFVAMTGDGVNDAPSLKVANIGIAMGITGTDVSKEAAHMILLDDNFATIIRAIREGRRIYDNIRKFVKYIMTCNGAEIWTIFMAPLLGLPIPLLPIHILWINLVTDGLPGLALSAEKAEKNIMQRKPRKTNESLFSEGIGYHIVWVGILMASVTLALQGWAISNENPRWQTMVFTVLSLAQLGHVFAIRSDHEYIFRIGFFSNKPLLFAVVLTFGLQMCVIYLPFANRIFKTQPLTATELLISISGAVVVFVAVEVEKWVKKLRARRRYL
jgi:P-type Ca2+ transporter type 2C